MPRPASSATDPDLPERAPADLEKSAGGKACFSHVSHRLVMPHGIDLLVLDGQTMDPDLPEWTRPDSPDDRPGTTDRRSRHVSAE
jgi:hypothetical protein